MNPKIDSYLRHVFTAWITAAVVALTAWFTLPEADAQAVADGLGKIGEGVLILLAILVPALGRLVWAWAAKVFRTGSGEKGEQNGSGGLGSLPLFLMGTMAGVMGCLPSCSGSYPLTGSVSYQDAATGAKGGLTFSPGEAPRARVALPITDAKGRVVGHVDLTSAK
jgi:hypothetical protein